MAGKKPSGAKDTKSEDPDQKVSGDASAEESVFSEDDLVTEKVQQILSEHGIDADTMETMGKQFLDELLALQKEKPLVFLVGAFAVGCIVGRSFK